jgi:hypothetical protein
LGGLPSRSVVGGSFARSILPFVDILLTIFWHAIDQSGEAVRHSGDGFERTELGAQASVLHAYVGLAPQ